MLSREMQCAYRSKFCNAPRATKLDGTLHKLCDFHRRKANANQQRLHKRKKRILEQQTASLSSGTTEPIDGFTFHNSFDQLEVKILEVLLFGSECGAIRQSPQLLMKDEDCFLYPVSPTTPSMALEPVSDGPWPVML
ncbi:unnamed protein product [Peronospora belbahrii]|uniref:Uncharacterized protein n=1 Tax=Peronospora belbahrii TaxID=622444 RepID=A0AAU9LNZ8_9STRA|nr:unnamed protein product [Peronospora belbahrii]